jgi:octaprenyl-diphosphate synthase
LAVAIDLKQQKPSDGGGIEPLIRLVEGDLKRVNEIILDKMQSPVALIPQLAGHIIAAGGKRLRPMLTLASARLCDAAGERQMALAACVEFIHTATLLHDDVVDASELRRGLQTANAVFGNKASVLVGDFLFSRAFQLMVEDGSLKVLKALSDASAIIAEGEVHQLMTANDMATDEAAYLEVIRAKTAALFAAACQVGAVVAERPERDEQALYAYGLNFGIAFQLVDDILDYTGDDGGLGKSRGDDFRDGKITLPVVLAYARGDETERAFWRRCLEDLDQREGDFAHALQLLERHQAIAESKSRARAYGERASEAMAALPDNAARRALLEVVDFCVERLY